MKKGKNYLCGKNYYIYIMYRIITDNIYIRNICDRQHFKTLFANRIKFNI